MPHKYSFEFLKTLFKGKKLNSSDPNNRIMHHFWSSLIIPFLVIRISNKR